MKIKSVITHCLLRLLLLVLQISPAHSQSREKCVALSGINNPDLNMQITRTEWRENFTPPPNPPGPPINDIFPPHRHVESVIDKRTAHDGKPYAIGFAVNLPADWNGRFMFQGGGGLNGSVPDIFRFFVAHLKSGTE